MSLLSRSRPAAKRTKGEWVTLAISIVLLVVLVAGVAWIELKKTDEPPRITAEASVDEAWRHDDRWYVPVTITNDGEQTTDMLVVEVENALPGEEPETADLEFAFVAGGEEVAGIAVFEGRPTTDSVSANPIAITEP